ncbi:hypothetical protein HDK77DRAFT_484611 [Phyllosticta capitalensis]
MLFRYLAHQESHYAYANSCIHPHAAVAETMSVSVPQPQLEQQRADEKQDDNKAKEMLAADSTTTAATGASDLNKAGQDAERKPEAAVEAPARVFGPQFKFTLVSLFAALAIAAPSLDGLDKRCTANYKVCSSASDCCSGKCEGQMEVGTVCKP